MAASCFRCWANKPSRCSARRTAASYWVRRPRTCSSRLVIACWILEKRREQLSNARDRRRVTSPEWWQVLGLAAVAMLRLLASSCPAPAVVEREAQRFHLWHDGSRPRSTRVDRRILVEWYPKDVHVPVATFAWSRFEIENGCLNVKRLRTLLFWYRSIRLLSVGVTIVIADYHLGWMKTWEKERDEWTDTLHFSELCIDVIVAFFGLSFGVFQLSNFRFVFLSNTSRRWTVCFVCSK